MITLSVRNTILKFSLILMMNSAKRKNEENGEYQRKAIKLDINDSTKVSEEETTQPQFYTFPVMPLSRYQGICATYQKPVEIGCFSLDSKRKLHMDSSELKYYYPLNLVDADLSHGYDTFIERDPTVAEHIDALLDSLCHIREKNPDDKNKANADFVTWRGIITKILCIPYTQNESWELGATLWNGTIFIEEHITEEKLKSQHSNSRHALMSYWGYKFESLSTIPKPPSQLNPINDPVLEQRKLEIVNTNIQYGTVVKTKLGSNSLVLGAEVDCIKEKKPLPPQDPLPHYIELKTSRVIHSKRDETNFEKRKLIKFWAQSFLVGTPTIICGFRDDDGFVQTVQTLETLKIPRMVRGKEGMWDATVCLNFANAFLDWIKTVVKIDDPMVTYTIRWKQPWKGIEVFYEGKKNAFLTDKYLKEFGRDRIDKGVSA